MFSALESTWDGSARRGWSTLASFGFQAMAASLLLLIPLLTIQGPPKLQWFEPPQILTPPPAPAPAVGGERHLTRSTNLSGTHLVQPPAIPLTIAILNEPPVASAPDIDRGGVRGGINTGRRGGGVWNSIGNDVEVASPPPPPTRLLRISDLGEGSLIYRAQPAYPPIARQARIQGPVELRAIISRAGTIENLVAVSGHPMLVAAALKAVGQWRYRPYLLNGEPIEVETEITVNFVLAGN